MSSNNYVPASVIPFCVWTEDAMGYAAANHERWGVEAPDETMISELRTLEELAAKCQTPAHTSVDIHDRNALHKKIEHEVRGYLQGVVMHNPKVTDHDRDMMGLPLRDSKPTPVGDPEGQAEADITYPGRTQLQLRIKHVEGTPANTRANYGCRIYYGVYAAGQPQPASGKDLRESLFTRRHSELFTFQPEDSGKTAFFCIRYENSKGKAGPWGPVFSAIIP